MHGASHILATDLDGTLVGDTAGLQQLLDFYAQQSYEVSLIYITGRHFSSVLSLIETEKLPIPQILVTDVGTQIYTGEHFEEDKEWTAQMQQDWMPERIDQIAADIPGIVKQQLPITNRCSFYATDPSSVEDFKQRLEAADIPHKLIFSGGKDLDVLPKASGKGQALTYLLDKYQIQDANLLIAGDSGNDLEMLSLGLPSVIVGNAQPELLESPEHPSVFRATKGFAGGIHEAWNHFHIK